MRGCARLGDRVSGICNGPGHSSNLPTGGTIVTASSDVSANNRGVARIGDKVQLDCNSGHLAVIVSSSPDVKANRDNARLGDKVQGDNVSFQGEIVTSSPDVFVN